MSYSRAATDDYFVTSPQSYNSASYTPVTEYSPHYDYNVNNQWRPPPDSRHNSETFINPANGYQSTGSFEADPDNLPDPSTLQHRFRRRDQILKQLRVVLGRFILSFAICAAIVIVLLYYQNMKEMKTSNKHFFNAIHTGLLLILGLNIVSAFKEMADIFRWKLLASRRNKSEGDTMGLRGAGGRDISAGFSAQEVDLILGISSYQKCCRLMWHWLRKRPMLFFPLTAWVLFGIAIQVAVAALGLTHNVDEADESARIRTVPGDILTSDLSAYYLEGGWSGSQDVPTWWNQNSQSQILGISGEMTLRFDVDPAFTEFEPDVFVVPGNETGRDETRGITYKYYFQEAVPSGSSRIRVKSDRYITVNSTCAHYSITNGTSGDDISYPISISGNPPVLVPWISKEVPYGYIHKCQATHSTVYSNPFGYLNATEKVKKNATGNGLEWNLPPQKTCGPRCGYVQIFRFSHNTNPDSKDNSIPGDYFQCETEVSKVMQDGKPVDNEEFQLPDSVALRAASSIGSDALSQENGAQCQRYVNATRFDWTKERGPSTIHLAETSVARFAISSIAMLDASNPYIRMKGLIFGTTFVLKVKEENVYLILSSILLAQLLTGISVIVACRNTFCRDSGYIGIARILRGVAEKMGKFGSAATDKEIWAFYKNRRMRYGVTGGTELGEGMERLDILMDRQEVIRRKSMHAGGVYA